MERVEINLKKENSRRTFCDLGDTPSLLSQAGKLLLYYFIHGVFFFTTTDNAVNFFFLLLLLLSFPNNISMIDRPNSKVLTLQNVFSRKEDLIDINHK
jgi:hypothetical protein